MTVGLRSIVVAVIAASLFSGCSGGTEPTTATSSDFTTTSPPTDPIATGSDLAEVFADAYAFTSSPAGSAGLDAQQQLVAGCMADLGLQYKATVAAPGTPPADASSYGIVEYMLNADQNAENAAIEAAMSAGDALAWREALSGPPRSQGEIAPVSDEAAQVGCGPAALPRFVGVQHAKALIELVDRSTGLASTASTEPDVVAARTSHDRCLVEAAVGVTAADVASGFSAYPVIRGWFDTALAGSQVSTVRTALDAGDPETTRTVDALLGRETELFAADRDCNQTADPGVAFRAAMSRASRVEPAAAAERSAYFAALVAARDAVPG